MPSYGYDCTPEEYAERLKIEHEQHSKVDWSPTDRDVARGDVAEERRSTFMQEVERAFSRIKKRKGITRLFDALLKADADSSAGPSASSAEPRQLLSRTASATNTPRRAAR